MPELPEVETVKNVLIPIVSGHTITKIDVLRKTTIQGDINEFVSSLVGEKFLDISRIGKFLIFHLSNDKVIISHLRMEGKYYEYKEEEPDSKYARVVFHLDNNHKLCYDDSRCFGIMILSNEENYRKEKEIAKLGPEPFDISDVDFLLKANKNKKLPIKNTLLDQSLITGLGNIYVDEVLYASNIHPLTPANKITKQEWLKIVDNAKKILSIAIEMGGSTIKSYHPGKDIDGNFQTRIKIYGKSGENCPTCGSTYRFIKVGGRGTTFCPKCQQKIGAPINVAVTGKIASGKSTFLEICKKENIPTLSSDEIVSELYKQDAVVNEIEKLLKIQFKNHILDRKALTENILLNPKNKKKLEKYIHGLVLKEIKNFLANEKSPIRVVEVPLLFEAKMDNLFDTIVVVDIDEDKQNKLLQARNGEKAMILKELNSHNKIDENKNKALYLISNDGSISDLEKKCHQVINKLRDRLG